MSTFKRADEVRKGDIVRSWFEEWEEVTGRSMTEGGWVTIEYRGGGINTWASNSVEVKS